MYRFKIYKTQTCQWCVKLQDYIANNVPYESLEAWYVDDPFNKDKLDELKAAGLKTVPQVWYQQGDMEDWVRIGGYEDFVSWWTLFKTMDADNELES